MAGSKGAAKAAKAAQDDSEQEPLKIQNLGDMAQIKRVLDETAVAVRVFSHLPLLRSPKRGARTICARTTHAIRAYLFRSRYRPRLTRTPYHRRDARNKPRLSWTWGTTRDTW